MIIREYISGISSIGVLSLATEKYSLTPYFIEENTLTKFENTLKVPVKPLNIGNSSLIGALCCGNSYGLVLPPFTISREREILSNFLKDNNIDIIVKELNSKNTAYGNLIVLNDKGCIISEELRQYKKTFEDLFNVEVEISNIAGLPTIGSNAIATNKGGLIHPEATDEEIELFKEVLKIPTIERATACKGSPSVGASIIANTNGAIVGKDTTGPELLKIEEGLDLID